jgi:DNA-binding MarR family transcriptional regulator
MASESRAAARPMTIAEVAESLGLLSRLMARLSEAQALRTASLGLTEWLFLRLLAADSSLRAGVIAKRLGVSAPRATQLLKELRQAGLIAVRPAADDSRAKTLTMTARGKTLLADLDRAVMEILEPHLARRPQALRGAANLARGLLKDLGSRAD